MTQLRRKATLPTNSAEVLDRVCDAYGFTTSLQLAEYLEMASSSMSARRTRGIFPADIVVKCALETGANLEWLATGEGKRFDSDELDILKIKRKKLVDGQMYDAGTAMFDKVFFKAGIPLPNDPICLQDEYAQYIIDRDFSEVYDGEWLVNIEGKISVRSLVRIPIKKVRVSGIGMAFDCALEDIDVIGRIVLKITN